MKSPKGVVEGEEVCGGVSHATCVQAVETIDSISLDWRPPNYHFGTIFEVKIKLSGDMEWTLVYFGKATSSTINGLPSGAKIAVHIRAVNEGTNGWSCIALYNTLPTPPGVPTALTASLAGSNEVVLEWHHPLYDGGSPITSFCLERQILQRAITLTEDEKNFSTQKSNDPVTIALGNCTKFYIEGLEPGVIYCFRVQALNMLGAGLFSVPIVVHMPSLPPNVPEPPIVVNKTFKSTSLRWLSPSCNGASIESFTLQLLFLGYGEKCLPPYLASSSTTNLDLLGTSKDDFKKDMVLERSIDNLGLALDDVYIGPSNKFVVKKLRPFSTYAFRVQARNAIGTSGYSAFSTCLIPAAAPCPPGQPTVVEAASSSLTFIWEIPELDNGSPVLQYTLEMQKVEINTRSIGTLDSGKITGKKKWSKRVPLTTKVWIVVYKGLELWSQVSDLAPGNEYCFRVKACNALGTSAPSSTSIVFTPPTAPAAPLAPSFGRITPTSVQIKWASPVCDNGMPVISYELLLDDGQGGPFHKVYKGDVRSFNASKLVPAFIYRVAVQAINACGASEMSEVAVVELPVELPEALPIAAPSPTPVVDDLFDFSPRQAVPISGTLEVVVREKTRPAPTTLEVKVKRKGGALVGVDKEEATTPKTIKSMKEVKELMRLKMRQAWPQRISRALIQTSWHVEQLWPLWAFLVCVGMVAYIFIELYTKG